MLDSAARWAGGPIPSLAAMTALLFVILVSGCEDAKKAEPNGREADLAIAAAQPKPEAAAAEEPDKRGKKSDKKNKIVEQASAAAPAGRARPKDLSKWELPDLKGALAQKELPFAFATMMYSAKKPGDPKQAANLDVLLREAAKMTDDPAVNLPLGAGVANAGRVVAVPGPVAAPAAVAAPGAIPGKPGAPAFKMVPLSQIRMGKNRQP